MLKFGPSFMTMVMGFTLSSAAYAVDEWPDLPVGVKNGVSAQVGSQLYVGLGSAGQQWYRLDLNQKSKGWQAVSHFSGPSRDGATATAIGKNIYVFGGSGKAKAQDKSPIIFDTIYRYQVDLDKWEEMDAHTPVGLLGASSYSPNGEEILFFGGYNKTYFDQYLASITAVDKETQPEKWQSIVDGYMGMKPADYKWNNFVISFEPHTGFWRSLGEVPYSANCGAALVQNKKNAVIISGEIKPGLRTAEVKEYQFGTPSPWLKLNELPVPQGFTLQEGVAGSFAGMSHDAMIVMGGANFHGAQQAFAKGKMFAHAGLSKSYNPEMYVYQDKQWQQVNDFISGLAYGSSFTTSDGVLIAGGENSDGQASNKVYLLNWNGKTVDIID
ncbi:N-acetylneuraminate epimerase [Photobacterium damselae]|uniref:N-acetylneuraminate epimerase n=1 Tax=Photobacterium damselae TaxID=38293 RepID=UPI00165E3699|nr:N-acetylneuraminate epimerase [Photobacterium damselae]